MSEIYKTELPTDKPAMTNMELAALAAELWDMGYLYFYDRLYIAMDAGEKKIGSIFLAEGAEQKKWSGTIIGVGGGEMAKASGVRPTDRVTFSRWNPTVVELVRKDGSPVFLNAYHAHDLYVGWRDPEAHAEYLRLISG